MLVDLYYFYRAWVLGGVAALIAVVALGGMFWGTMFAAEHVPLQCMLLDVSESTLTAQSKYSALSRDILKAQSDRDGHVCFIAVKGAPAGESDVSVHDLGADHPDNSSDAPLERVEKQVRVASDIDVLLQHPTQTIEGSALVEALAILARKMHPGDTIHVFSDGLQDSANFVLRRLNSVHYSDAAIRSALDGLASNSVLASLAGVKVVFETPGFRPGTTPSVVGDADAERFWRAWAGRVHAHLTWSVAG